MVFVYGGITWTDAFSLILCYVTVAFFAGSIGICFSAAFKRSTVSTVVTYGTLTAVVAGTYFLNRFALSVSGMDLQRSAAYVLGESSAKASSGTGRKRNTVSRYCKLFWNTGKWIYHKALDRFQYPDPAGSGNGPDQPGDPFCRAHKA